MGYHLAPHQGLDLELMKMGRVGPLLEPRRRPQAGKSGDPRSQNADNGDGLDEIYHVIELVLLGFDP